MANVLILIPYYGLFPPRNGGQLRSFYLLRELARQHEVHAIILQPERELRQPADGYEFPASVKVYGPAQTPPPPSLFDKLPRRVGPGLHYRWLQRSWRGPASSILLQSHHLICQILSRHHIDMAIFTNGASMTAASLVKRLSPQTVCVLNSDDVVHRLLAQFIKNPTGNRVEQQIVRQSYQSVRWYETHLARFVDAFFVCSDDDRALLASLNENKIKGFTIPNGVDIEKRPFDAQPGKNQLRHILFCGTLDAYENEDGLLWFYRQIWPSVLSQQPGCRLVVIGRGGKSEQLDGLRTDPQVDFIGPVEDVVPYYQQAAISIVPLRMGSGTRLKILEALSLGNPVVSTHIGAEGIDVLDGEHLLLADTPEQFAVAIARLLGDEELFGRLRHSGRKLVEEKYDWRRIGDKMHTAIDLLGIHS